MGWNNLLAEWQHSFLIRHGYSYQSLEAMNYETGSELISGIKFARKQKRAEKPRRYNPARALDAQKRKEAGVGKGELNDAKKSALEACNYACQTCGKSYKKDGVRTKCFVLDYKKLDILVQCKACNDVGASRPKVVTGFAS